MVLSAVAAVWASAGTANSKDAASKAGSRFMAPQYQPAAGEAMWQSVAGSGPTFPCKVQPVSSLSWLVRLRWVEIAAQLVVFLAGDRSFRGLAPVAGALTVIGLQVASNIAGALWARRGRPVPEGGLVLLMGFDCAALTALILLGGPDARFLGVLYMVDIALAAMLVRARWTWALATGCLASLALLFTFGTPEDPGHADPVEWQLREAWLSFGVTAGLLVYFLQRTARMLRDRDATLEEARREVERKDKLASLATLAAGAAHELGTPLSTIALVARELEHRLERGPVVEATLADARLIRSEVERCRHILTQLGADLGASQGEAPEAVTPEALLRRAIEATGQSQRIELTLEPALATQPLLLPVRAVGQALLAVLGNGLAASPKTAVSVRVARHAAGLSVDVTDQGAGMSPTVLAQAGEPFFTTKGPGRGMGLGLFLTRSILEQVGGALTLESVPGTGTTAHVVLPLRVATHSVG